MPPIPRRLATAALLLLAGPALGQATAPVGRHNPNLRVPPVGQIRLAPEQPPTAVQIGRTIHVGQLRPTSPVDWQRMAQNLRVDPAVVAQLPINRIADQLRTRFQGRAVGMSFAVIDGNGRVNSFGLGDARRAPDDEPRQWTGGERLSIASVSKMITATAIVKAAAANNVPLDTPAYKYLPSDWTFSDGFKTITLRQLLDHTSGLRDCGVGLSALKTCAAKAVNLADKDPSLPLSTRYRNEDFAFLRVVLPRLYGQAPTTAQAMGESYVNIVNQQVLQPAGVVGVNCIAGPRSALGYRSTTDNDDSYDNSTAGNVDWSAVKPGVNWGDRTAICGSEGWYLSSEELAKFMHTLMYSEKILPNYWIGLMMQWNLGMYCGDNGGGLQSCNHNGWYPGPAYGGEVNTLLITFNNGITVAMEANSRVRGGYYDDVVAAVREGTKTS